MTLTMGNAAHAAIGVLNEAGVTAIFGNPGTTELPLMQAIGENDGIRYYLALHEDVSVGMAAGYAAASGQVGVAMLHAVPGVAHGLCNYYNAFRNGLPVLLISGQQDRRHQFLAPMLYGNMEQMVAPYAKWVWEARTAQEIPAVMRRAVTEAMSAPTGPTFLSIPLDLQFEAVDGPPRGAGPIPGLGGAVKAQIGRAVECILSAKSPAFVAGDLIGRNRCEAELASLAHEGAIAAYWEPMSFYCNFPTTHPSFQGVLFPSGEDFRRVFRDHDLVIWCGSDLRTPLLYDGIAWHDAGTTVIVLSDQARAINEGFAPDLHLVGDPKLTLDALLEQLQSVADESARGRIGERRDSLAALSAEKRSKIRSVGQKRSGQVPLAPVSAISAILQSLPPHTIVVDDAVSNSGWVSMCGEYALASDYLGPSKGGGIGFGLPLAMGAKAACPDRPVVAFLGDGSAMYSIQGLWTAAHHHLPVLFIILNNSSYRILKGGVLSMFGDSLDGESLARVPGFDLDQPTIDFVACARSFGVEAMRVESLADCEQAATRALRSGKPWLLDIPVEREVRKVLR